MKVEGGFQVSVTYPVVTLCSSSLIPRPSPSFSSLAVWFVHHLQGRTNKLVDGCYSFWQGGVFPLIYIVLKEQGTNWVVM